MRHLSHALRQTAGRYPDNLAIIYQDQRLTWAEVERRVDNLAAAFLHFGVQRGDRIGMFCRTRPEYIITYLAAARVGAILCGFNIHYTAREIVELADEVQPALMVVQGEMGVAAQLRPLIEAMPYVQQCLFIGENPDGWWDLNRLAEQQPSARERAMLDQRLSGLSEEDGALMVFTGGVDGIVRGALLSHKSIVATIGAQNQALGWVASDRIMHHLPMNHVSGATLMTVGALLAGATLVMLDRFHPERVLELIQRERVTILGQVPAMWIMESLLPTLEDYDLSSVRLAIVSGAPTPPDIIRWIAALAPRTVHAWGLTEAAGMITTTQAEDDVETLVRSAGICLPAFELAIKGEDGKMLEPGQEGEICVRGDCVFSGYFGHPRASAAVIDEEGWLHTGDLGRVDEAGYLTWTGLKKEMYICGGYNVYPPEVEAYLRRHPAIDRCACLGAPDRIMGQIGALFILPKPGADLSIGEIRRYCKEGLARYKNPRMIEISRELPLTPDGEIDKQALRERLQPASASRPST